MKIITIPEICFLVWITINSSVFEQWNIPIWASHFQYWQITLKFHLSAWTKVLKNKNKNPLFAFKFLDLLRKTNLFFYFEKKITNEWLLIYYYQTVKPTFKKVKSTVNNLWLFILMQFKKKKLNKTKNEMLYLRIYQANFLQIQF